MIFKQIEIIKEYDKSIPFVNCESSKIQQVFLNILRNGAEAMQDEIGIKNVDKKPKFNLRIIDEPNSDKVKIEIEDNGPGMEKEVRKRIFEPFFTTKPTDKGTGLGLSVSYFIIEENHGGEMKVESELGKGSKFIIKLLKS